MGERGMACYHSQSDRPVSKQDSRWNGRNTISRTDAPSHLEIDPPIDGMEIGTDDKYRKEEDRLPIWLGVAAIARESINLEQGRSSPISSHLLPVLRLEAARGDAARGEPAYVIK